MPKLPNNIHPSHRVVSVARDGRTFVCGDLHGCYDELWQEMHQAGFDRARDHLIVLGDLTDRGIKNYECVKLLAEPWFHSVLGNHDEMMLNAVNPRSDKHFWRVNGGGWFDLLSEEQQEEVQYLCDRFVERLPLSMTLLLPDGSHIGLMHADAPTDWHAAVEGHQPRMETLWGRRRIKDKDQTSVANVDLVLVGHTSNNAILRLGNVIYLDTGAGFRNGRLTMVEIGQSLEELEANLQQRIELDRSCNFLPFTYEPIGDYETG
ncbi:metallophosphoesterase [Kordiimonas lipolytica]|uniref:Metallophosphoesterase n=1 Tax=Kordiimonas lipolytica TaxID=1662421 RepID=A0ABV8UFG2_9PROT|nr:metallophosphoesterase [Kordiimonas lipolytica]